jgi:hypothetical protein
MISSSISSTGEPRAQLSSVLAMAAMAAIAWRSLADADATCGLLGPAFSVSSYARFATALRENPGFSGDMRFGRAGEVGGPDTRAEPSRSQNGAERLGFLALPGGLSGVRGVVITAAASTNLPRSSILSRPSNPTLRCCAQAGVCGPHSGSDDAGLSTASGVGGANAGLSRK